MSPADYLAATRRGEESEQRSEQQQEVEEATRRWPPARPGCRQAVSCRRALARRLDQDRFVARVLSWHRVVRHTAGPLPMCACGSPWRLCGYVNAAHELLGLPVPWDRADHADRAEHHGEM